MVYTKIDERQAKLIDMFRFSNIVSWSLCGIFAITFVAVSLCFGETEHQPIANNNQGSGDVGDTSASVDTIIDQPQNGSHDNFQKIDFQTVVDNWAKQTNGQKSVIIYDVDLGERVGEYNVDQLYNMASLYKLFVVYEGYRKIENGEWREDEILNNGETISRCLDLAIRESDSSCGELLWDKIGRENLDRATELYTNDGDVNLSALTSTAEGALDIMLQITKYWQENDGQLIEKMKDSFLVQPVTTYDWRQGLPSGFSEHAAVYNKVGWDYDADAGFWNVYHDVALVEFKDTNRRFIVVVMTSQLPFYNISNFAKMLEEHYLSSMDTQD